MNPMMSPDQPKMYSGQIRSEEKVTPQKKVLRCQICSLKSSLGHSILCPHLNQSPMEISSSSNSRGSRFKNSGIVSHHSNGLRSVSPVSKNFMNEGTLDGINNFTNNYSPYISSKDPCIDNLTKHFSFSDQEQRNLFKDSSQNPTACALIL